MKIALIGLGAVGVAVAVHLNDFLKDDFCCIVDEKRKERYEKDGIFYNGKKVSFNYVTPETVKECDLVIIATKNLQLEEALKMMKGAVGKNTAILSLLNGVQSEEEIAKVYGEEKTLYGYIVGLSSVKEGNIVVNGNEGTIYFGENDNSKSQRVMEIKKVFDDAKVLNAVPEDIHLSQWKKFLLNVPCNTISSICRATYKYYRSEVTKNLVRKCAKEVIAVANAKGIALTEKMCEENLDLMASLDENGKVSMLQDVEAKRFTENKFFCGTVSRYGKELGIETPVCDFLEQMVECIELGF